LSGKITRKDFCRSVSRANKDYKISILALYRRRYNDSNICAYDFKSPIPRIATLTLTIFGVSAPTDIFSRVSAVNMTNAYNSIMNICF